MAFPEPVSAENPEEIAIPGDAKAVMDIAEKHTLEEIKTKMGELFAYFSNIQDQTYQLSQSNAQIYYDKGLHRSGESFFSSPPRLSSKNYVEKDSLSLNY